MYCAAWEQLLQSAIEENQLKSDLLHDADFDIAHSFKTISTNGKEITRADLLAALNNILDQPHIDILYARLIAQTSTKTSISYADFIEQVSPKWELQN